MSDVNEDNFDRAFDLIRPVIQGSADVGKFLTEGELQKTMDFCRHLFAPTTPEMYSSVRKRVNPELMSSSAPVLTEHDLDKLLDPNDLEAKFVLCEVNARKPIHTMYSPTHNFATEVHVGMRAIVEHGRLGLVQA
ncbi:hypothetical protein A0H81_13348 [Grifola frondosa]|uniref:Uncharacterized protein n=1 Tax=Grifola frondosa TaxID=5627 RepID=A0A1C7LPV0_GRIFR|nr:hypothetical protein A0H81_13348 [Grifola frondosa]